VHNRRLGGNGVWAENPQLQFFKKNGAELRRSESFVHVLYEGLREKRERHREGDSLEKEKKKKNPTQKKKDQRGGIDWSGGVRERN